MNRRALFGMVLGALAAPFLTNVSGKVAMTKVPIDELFISQSADVSAAIAGLSRYPTTMASVRTVMSPAEVKHFGRELDRIAGKPRVTIGPLIIRNKAEADAFIERMAQAIADGPVCRGCDAT